jgi:hypothetical protein
MNKTIHLQGIGKVQATEAENLKLGSVLVWNFGNKSKVVDIMPRGKKQLTIIEAYTSCNGKVATAYRYVSRTRLIAYESI